MSNDLTIPEIQERFDKCDFSKKEDVLTILELGKTIGQDPINRRFSFRSQYKRMIDEFLKETKKLSIQDFKEQNSKWRTTFHKIAKAGEKYQKKPAGTDAHQLRLMTSKKIEDSKKYVKQLEDFQKNPDRQANSKTLLAIFTKYDKKAVLACKKAKSPEEIDQLVIKKIKETNTFIETETTRINGVVPNKHIHDLTKVNYIRILTNTASDAMSEYYSSKKKD